mmetsp:Transcript_5370/g.8318  ORF Transcript_5370/g.8318 Transcript_5370/m.8318 type:complete len:272 (+) Transcript_5370:274-1089(+)
MGTKISPGLLGIPFFREFVLESTEVLVPERPGSYQVRRLRFKLPEGAALGIDTHKGEVVKIKRKRIGKARSYCVTSARDQVGYFDIVVKVYGDRNGISAYLGSLGPGESALFTHLGFGPWGGTKIRKRISPPSGFLGTISYGIGITKILPVLREELKSPTLKKAILLWANRSTLDLTLEDEVETLVKQYGSDRLEVKHIFSREEGIPGTLHGRINEDVLKQVFAQFDQADSRFLVVGSKAMMKNTYKELTKSGFSGRFYSSWGRDVARKCV